MDIVIISQYLRDISSFEDNNSRFVYLAKLLAQNPENEVEIITSDFNHSTKKHFTRIGQLPGVRVSVLQEPGYPKNICLQRFASHRKLAKNISDYLSARQRPDICYCAVPSLDVGDAVAQYCKKNGVRFIIDVQDLWPEAFKMVFRVPVLSDLIFAPLQRQADAIYALADDVVAVSKTYADRVMRVNKKCIAPKVAFLGTEKETFDSYCSQQPVRGEKITVGYIGTMASSYDLTSVIEAVALIQHEVPIKLLAMGDGALREAFIKHAKEKELDAEFTGKLLYPQMVQRLLTCDIAVNPIRKGSAGSVINKVGDYAMAGLPVVNTQECPEYRALLDEYQAGINCECENANEIAAALKSLAQNRDMREQMARNSRKLGVEWFDRKTVYGRLVDQLFTAQ